VLPDAALGLLPGSVLGSVLGVRPGSVLGLLLG
jgi:hypothetical protein